MRVVLDTNVILDVLLARVPFATDSAQVLGRIERGDFVGFACATSITTVHYLVSKAVGSPEAEKLIAQLLKILKVLAADQASIEDALGAAGPDFEDKVIQSAARLGSIDFIITRDPKGFAARLPQAISPREFLERSAAASSEL